MDKLRTPWSDSCGVEEKAYRAFGFAKTAGSVYALPPFDLKKQRERLELEGEDVSADCFTVGGASHFPNDELLRIVFETRHGRGSGRARLSHGARALCKHFERRVSDAEHPYWRVPTGTEVEKNAKALLHLDEMLAEATWRNIYRLHADVLIYEVRNPARYGMRWTIHLNPKEDCDPNLKSLDPHLLEDNFAGYTLSFRGFLEPDHAYAA